MLLGSGLKKHDKRDFRLASETFVWRFDTILSHELIAFEKKTVLVSISLATYIAEDEVVSSTLPTFP